MAQPAGGVQEHVRDQLPQVAIVDDAGREPEDLLHVGPAPELPHKDLQDEDADVRDDQCLDAGGDPPAETDLRAGLRAVVGHARKVTHGPGHCKETGDQDGAAGGRQPSRSSVFQ